VSNNAGTYFTAMTGTNSCKWSFGCGGGSYTSASGVGNTGTFASANLQGIFTMLFGSYFGDWDVPDNFLRAPLCQGKMLTSVWAGRPHWMFHHMGMGENIGYSTMLTQNNTTTYFPTPYPANAGLFNTVHIALMGDPTLRNHIVAPVSNVIATKTGFDCLVSWSASTETNVIGYNLYMKNDTNTSYVKLNASPITTTSFTDYCLRYPGIYKYMVRTLKLENTASGSYYNMSEGIADTAFNSNPMLTLAAFSSTLNSNDLIVTNTSTYATTLAWDFGNGATDNSANPPTITYTANGAYIVSLVASNQCFADTAYEIINILTTSLSENTDGNTIGVWPNPSNGKVKMDWGSKQSALVSVFNVEGKEVISKKTVAADQTLDLSFLSKGLYFLEIKTAEATSRKKLVLE
jgi:PKD repeat protein